MASIVYMNSIGRFWHSVNVCPASSSIYVFYSGSMSYAVLIKCNLSFKLSDIYSIRPQSLVRGMLFVYWGFFFAMSLWIYFWLKGSNVPLVFFSSLENIINYLWSWNRNYVAQLPSLTKKNKSTNFLLSTEVLDRILDGTSIFVWGAKHPIYL